MISYEEQEIQTVMNLLNSISVKGVGQAAVIVKIAEIISGGKKDGQEKG